MRLKRITALAASASLVVASMAGCSKESSEETSSAAVAESTTVAPETTKAPETEAPTEKETEKETKASEKETKEEDAKQTEPEETKKEADETKPEETEPEETEPEETKSEDPEEERVYFPEVNEDYADSAKGLADVVEALPIDLKEIKAESVNTFKIKVHTDAKNGVEGSKDKDEEIEGKLIFTTEGDEDEDQVANVGIDVSYNGMNIKGDICSLYKVGDNIYVDLKPAYKLVFTVLGEGMQQQVEPILTALGLDATKLQSLLAFTIPIPAAAKEITLSKETTEAMEDMSKLIVDDVVLALSYNDYVTKDGDSYCVKINEDNLAYLIMDVVSAFDTNLDEIYDSGVRCAESVDPVEIFDQIMAASKDSFLPMISKYFAMNPQTDENGKAVQISDEELSSMIDEYIAEARKQIVEQYDDSKDMFDDPEMKKETFDSWTKMVNNILRISPEEATKSVKESLAESNGGFDIDVDVKKTSKGFGVDVEGALKTDIPNGNVSISFKSENTISFGADDIKAPEGFTSFDEAMKIAEELIEKVSAMQNAASQNDASAAQTK
ncbi:MAG: hypothetical protein K5927_07970 [Lachnospiraceae bacterium]|nr:hypothetical protein [Lachnospiraceae bacterium]